MIKRVVLMLLIGATLALGGVYKNEQSRSLTITGVSSGDDSTAVDTIALFNTRYYANRYWVTIEFDSVLQHGAGSTTDSFGLRDSIFVVLKAHYAGQYITLDSTEDSLKDNTTLRLDFTSDIGESLYKYGSEIFLIVRIADTVGLTEDSVATFKYRINGFHAYQD